MKRRLIMLDKLREFMLERGVTEDAIKCMEEEKIDEMVIPLMSDNALAKYLPRYGDRVAVSAFVSSLNSNATEGTLELGSGKGKSLIDRLKAKVRVNGEHQLRSSGQQGNGNAKKMSRRVEIGWIDFDQNNKHFKQVRQPSGGGTRHAHFRVDKTLGEVLNEVKDWFFVKGESRRGKLETFDFFITDSTHIKLEPDLTIAMMYEKTKCTLLRLYMATVRREMKKTDEAVSEDITLGERKRARMAGEDEVEEIQLGRRSPTEGEAAGDDLDDTLPFELPEVFMVEDTPPRRSSSRTVHEQCSVDVRGQTRLSSTPLTIPTEPLTMRGQEDELTDGNQQQPATANVVSDITAPSIPTPASLQQLISIPSNLVSPIPSLPQLPGAPSTINLTQFNLPATSDASGHEHSSVKDILSCLEKQVNDSLPANVINVSRYNLHRQAHKAFKKDSFKDTAPLSIRFTGEVGIDNGGLSREFMSIAIRGLAEQSIFSGEIGKDLVLDFAAINNRIYFTTGRMMAYFLVHRGPTPCFLSDNLYQLLVNTNKFADKLSVNDVKDPDVEENIMKIVQASEAEYADTIYQLSDFIHLAGCSNLAFDFQKRPLLVKYLIRFFVVDRLSPALEQFKEGLSTLNVLKEMKNFPELLYKVFTPSEENKITVQDIIDMFVVEWSADGSNRHKKEAITHVNFLDLLDNLEREGELETFFAWTTGLTRLPILGFREKPTLGFDHPEDLVGDEAFRRGFPFVNTCGLILRLPVVESEEEFMENMRSAISFRFFTSS